VATIDGNSGSKHSTIPALTGIRGLGALWVFCYHVKDLIAQLFNVSIDDYTFFYYGYYGVDLFFVLSGFVICHAHFKDFENNLTDRLRYFFTTRAFRLYPIHITVMFAILMFVTLCPGFIHYQSMRSGQPHEFAPVTFLTSIFLVQAWTYWLGFSWNETSWTLSAEWLAYLAFPIIVFVLRRFKQPFLHLAGGVSLLVVFGLLMQKLNFLDINATHMSGLARALFGFTAGCLLNRFYMLYKKPLPASWLVCTIGFALVATAITTQGISDELVYLGFGLIVLSLAYTPRFYGKMIGTGVVYWLGQISFSFYLTHWIIVRGTQWIVATQLLPLSFAASVGVVAAVAVVSLTLGSLCFRFIEKPSRAFGRKIATRGETRAVTA
jgi:peptidoglycan/LPS O-acetylase OafA/YrhL